MTFELLGKDENNCLIYGIRKGLWSYVIVDCNGYFEISRKHGRHKPIEYMEERFKTYSEAVKAHETWSKYNERL